MSTKKSTSSSAKPAAATKKPAVTKQHDHSALEAEIASLKKEVAELKNQCAQCCAELAGNAQIKKSLELLEQKINSENSKDERLDKLIKDIMANQDYRSLRKFYKRNN